MIRSAALYILITQFKREVRLTLVFKVPLLLSFSQCLDCLPHSLVDSRKLLHLASGPLDTCRNWRHFASSVALITSSSKADLMHVELIPTGRALAKTSRYERNILSPLNGGLKEERRVARVNLPTTRVIKGVPIGDSGSLSDSKRTRRRKKRGGERIDQVAPAEVVPNKLPAVFHTVISR